MARGWTLAVLVTLGGCSRWAYTPEWAAAERTDSLGVTFYGGSQCGKLSVANTTRGQVAVDWERISAVFPNDDTREVKPAESKGSAGPMGPRPPAALGPDERYEYGLCVDHHLFVLRTRPPTVYDFALGWMFGAGILAGNVAWEPGDRQRLKAIPHPRDYGFDLHVPVRIGDAPETDLVVPVHGDGVWAYKYTDWAHGAPEPMEGALLPAEARER